LLWVFATKLSAEGLWRWLERPYQRRSAAAVLPQARPAAVQTTPRVRNTADEAQSIAAMLPFALDFQASIAWAGHPLCEAIGRRIYRAW
jgi:hypothetical protein